MMNHRLRSRRLLVRYYRGARTAHLERLIHFEPGLLVYRKPMYDFDTSEIPANVLRRVRRAGAFTIARGVVRGRISTLELAEPLTPSALIDSVIICAAVRLRDFTRQDRPRLVAYAIENGPVPAMVAARLRLPLSVVEPALRPLLQWLVESFDEIVFGTDAAQRNYAASVDMTRAAAPRTSLIWGLPSAITTALDERRPVALFLGALDERKGLVQLQDAWSQVKAEENAAELVVIGKGVGAESVRLWASEQSDVRFLEDPPRSVIAAQLDAARVLVLLSRSTSTWKEQIGLPIVEGLAHGLEIVASDEGGLATWLKDHGHVVIPSDAPLDQVACAVLRALRTTRSTGERLALLPREDGRLQADAALVSGSSIAVDPST